MLAFVLDVGSLTNLIKNSAYFVLRLYSDDIYSNYLFLYGVQHWPKQQLSCLHKLLHTMSTRVSFFLARDAQ